MAFYFENCAYFFSMFVFFTKIRPVCLILYLCIEIVRLIDFEFRAVVYFVRPLA